MLQLFKPESKVQKDRKIMRDTDARMAKYSRRGLLLTFGAFVICLLLGDFYHQDPEFAIVLALVLLLLTILRGYYLFRFDAIYARAPTRWRNHYFIASFIGAAWWSVILVSVTNSQGLESETTLLWLYSVVFYSTVANVFSPYRHFMSLYLFIGQIPVAITALLLGTAEGYLYGAMMIVFYLSLTHQGNGNCRTYWDRLEGLYALQQKAQGLESENRDSQAVVELKDEFLTNLGQEFRTSLNDVMGALSLLDDSDLDHTQRELLLLAERSSARQLDLVNNIMDFSRITNKKLVLDISVFNLHNHLEGLIENLSAEAHQQGVALNYTFGPDLPLRVKGDVARFNQILGNLASHAVKFSEQGEVLFYADFNWESESSGELQITISDQGQGGNTPDQEKNLNPYAEMKNSQAGTGLGLAICKALVERMGGRVVISSEPGQGSIFYVAVKIQTPGKQPQHFQPNPKLLDKKILLVNTPLNILAPLREDIERWGIHVGAVSDSERALQRLIKAAGTPEPYDLVLIYSQLKNLDALHLSEEITQSDALSELKQLLAVSYVQQDSKLLSQHIEKHQQVDLLTQPVFKQALHDAICKQLLGAEGIKQDEHKGPAVEHDHSQGLGKKILLVEDHRVNQMIAKGMLKKLGYAVKLANNGREALEIIDNNKKAFDLIIMDCQMPDMDGYAATQAIRQREQEQNCEKPVPIVAMTALAAEGDETRCLAAGMDDYLAKPVRYEELESRLRRWLGGNN